MDILPRIPERRPARWKDRRLQVGGAAAVLLAAGVLMLHQDPEQRLSLPQDLDTEMGLREIGGDRGGLAPGQAIGGYGRAVDRAVGDSLSMARGANRAPTPKELAARKPDWNEALRQVAQGGKKKKKRKPKGFIGKLKALMAKWGGGSGAPSSGMSLAKPSSEGFKLARRTGPGRFGGVKADSDFRSKYGDGSRARPSGKKTRVAVAGFLASAAGKARSMFGGGPRGSGARGPIVPGGGGVAGGGRVAPPGIPGTGEGKPVEDVNEKKKDADDDGDEEDAKNNIAESLINSLMGQTGGGNWRFGGKKDPDGKVGRSKIPTGVSRRGMDSDANSEETFGKDLVDAAQDHLSSNPPKYDADGFLGASKAKAQVAGIREYKPEGVNAVVDAAEGTKPPKALTTVPELITTEMGNLPPTFQPKETPQAVKLANETRTALTGYHASVGAFQKTLVTSAGTVSTLNGRADEFSKRLVTHQGELEATTKSLTELRGPLGEDAQGYDAPPTGTTQATFIQRASTRINTYAGKARPIYQTAITLNEDADSLTRGAVRDYDGVVRNMNRRHKAVTDARMELEGKYATLRTEISLISAEQKKHTKGDPYMLGMASNGEKILQNVREQTDTVAATYAIYSGRGADVLNGGLAIKESWKGLEPSPS